MAEKNYPVEVFHPNFLHAATVGGRGVCVAQTCADARAACKTAHGGTTRLTPQSEWLRRCAFLTCAAVQPLVLRPQAALGSGFSLQAAFWYQNAMLALFLRGKKSQNVDQSSFCLEEFLDFHFVQAMKFNIFALRMP